MVEKRKRSGMNRRKERVVENAIYLSEYNGIGVDVITPLSLDKYVDEKEERLSEANPPTFTTSRL